VEFRARGIELLTQYRMVDEFVGVYWNPLCGKRLPAVLGIWAADDVPIVATILNSTEGWKNMLGLEDTKVSVNVVMMRALVSTCPPAALITLSSNGKESLVCLLI